MGRLNGCWSVSLPAVDGRVCADEGGGCIWHGGIDTSVFTTGISEDEHSPVRSRRLMRDLWTWRTCRLSMGRAVRSHAARGRVGVPTTTRYGARQDPQNTGAICKCTVSRPRCQRQPPRGASQTLTIPDITSDAHQAIIICMLVLEAITICLDASIPSGRRLEKRLFEERSIDRPATGRQLTYTRLLTRFDSLHASAFRHIHYKARS